MAVDLLWPLPDLRKPHRIWNLGVTLVIPLVGILSKLTTTCLNKFDVYNRKTLFKALEQRPVGCPLVTVSNHGSCLDEPILWGNLKLRHLLKARSMRWSLGAHDICFTTPIHAVFFALGRTVPIVRGAGVYQKAMDFCIEQLNNGQWVHIFPEGKVNMTGEIIRFKWGVGRLISESKICPIVVPMWHVGMEKVLPHDPPYYPRLGKRVTLVIGQPLMLDNIVRDLKSSGKSEVEQRKHITDIIQGEMYLLRKEAEQLHSQNT